jgi:hypothetical protein
MMRDHASTCSSLAHALDRWGGPGTGASQPSLAPAGREWQRPCKPWDGAPSQLTKVRPHAVGAHVAEVLIMPPGAGCHASGRPVGHRDDSRPAISRAQEPRPGVGRAGASKWAPTLQTRSAATDGPLEREAPDQLGGIGGMEIGGLGFSQEQGSPLSKTSQNAPRSCVNR